MWQRLFACAFAVALSCVEAEAVVGRLQESGILTVIVAEGDRSNPSFISVVFSDDVLDALDEFFYYLQDVDDPNNMITVSTATHGSFSNTVVLNLARPCDPNSTYDLYIVYHTIHDRWGNPLADPTVVRVTFPTTFREGLGGYEGTIDTEVRFSSPDSAAGGQITALRTDGQDGMPVGEVHSLLRFDNFAGGGPNQVPLGATITKATLRIYTDDRGTSPVRVMRILVNWDENSTWNSMTDGVDQTNGVEAVQINTLDASDEAALGAPRVFDEVDVTATVQDWVNGQPNHGFAFLPTGPDGWVWVSSESPTVAERPALIVRYTDFPPTCQIMQQPQSMMVLEGQSFTLSVSSRGSHLSYQWFKNGLAISGAINSTYTVPRAKPSDNGDYYVRVSNAVSECVSEIATVMIGEEEPPRLVSALGNLDQTTITLQFNETLDVTSAQNLTHYAISGGLSIVGAAYSGVTVTLTSSAPREVGRDYQLTVRNVKDDSAAANVISPNPTLANLTQDVRLLSFNAVWRYQNEGFDLGSAWTSPQYDDSAWPQGPGLLGFETTTATLLALSNQNVSIGTRLNLTLTTGEAILTDYFRTLVNVPFDTAGVTFTIRHVVDDGALFYFNGAEVARFNMPTGYVDYLTVAPTAPPEGVIRSITNLTGLTSGLNSFAVELHNQSAASGDILFGAELIARVPRFAGRLAIVQNPDRTLTLSWVPQSAILEQASELDGDWSVVENAANPMNLPAATGARFYRLRGF